MDLEMPKNGAHFYFSRNICGFLTVFEMWSIKITDVDLCWYLSLPQALVYKPCNIHSLLFHFTVVVGKINLFCPQLFYTYRFYRTKKMHISTHIFGSNWVLFGMRVNFFNFLGFIYCISFLSLVFRCCLRHSLHPEISQLRPPGGQLSSSTKIFIFA